jgi:hypothetical protein
MHVRAALGMMLMFGLLLYAWPTTGAQVDATAGNQVPPIWAGVYTEEQARRGLEAYSTSCARCHRLDLAGDEAPIRDGETFMSIGPALKGDTFFRRWGDEDLNRLFLRIRDTMPPSFQAILDDNAKLDVLAYLLQANGFPAGSRELTLNDDDLERIRILRNVVSDVAVPSFRRVELVGCVLQGPNGSWMLAADAGFPPGPDGGRRPEKSSSRSAQAETYLLVNALPFKPSADQRVVVEGLVYREGQDRRLNVASLQMIETQCRR